MLQAVYSQGLPPLSMLFLLCFPWIFPVHSPHPNQSELISRVACWWLSRSPFLCLRLRASLCSSKALLSFTVWHVTNQVAM